VFHRAVNCACFFLPPQKIACTLPAYRHASRSGDKVAAVLPQTDTWRSVEYRSLGDQTAAVNVKVHFAVVAFLFCEWRKPASTNYPSSCQVPFQSSVFHPAFYGSTFKRIPLVANGSITSYTSNPRSKTVSVRNV
jgi:hypothetical protein